MITTMFPSLLNLISSVIRKHWQQQKCNSIAQSLSTCCDSFFHRSRMSVNIPFRMAHGKFPLVVSPCCLRPNENQTNKVIWRNEFGSTHWIRMGERASGGDCFARHMLSESTLFGPITNGGQHAILIMYYWTNPHKLTRQFHQTQ